MGYTTSEELLGELLRSARACEYYRDRGGNEELFERSDDKFKQYYNEILTKLDKLEKLEKLGD